MSGDERPQGPDLAQGIDANELADGAMMTGRVGDDAVLLARRGEEWFAIGATCTHYGGPLAEGLLVGDGVRCPWHHACFSLRSGAAVRPPALKPVPRWRVERQDGRVFVRERIEVSEPRPAGGGRVPHAVIIVGGGAAGHAASVLLRQEGYEGPITLISADDEVPYDRPNLSKEYLAGHAPEEWLPLRPADDYARQGIELLLRTRVVAIDAEARRIRLADGGERRFGALLLATGAGPKRLAVPGGDRGHVRTLRSLADCRAIIAAATQAKRAVVVGASFIGMEVAASLRQRGLEVVVVAKQRPLERTLGPAVGDFLKGLHEQHGVSFLLGHTPAAIEERAVRLDDGSTVAADLVVVGVGVAPVTDLAEKAGLAVDGGVLVNEYLATSAPGIFAAGDIARWPDRLAGGRTRVEHWVVALRQGQTAARNMLGRRERFDAVPFFWTRQYDTSIDYVGWAERWDAIAIDGSVADGDCTLTYRRDGKALAVATIGRNRDSLAAEAAFERRIAPAA